jgi:arylsulfatase A-like enzyme
MTRRSSPEIAVRRAGALIAALALAAVLGLGACSGGDPAAEGPPRHVLLITVDTLRADHLSPYGYPRETSPAVAALAEGGTLFERAIAQWPKTGPSFASMFTGQYPQTTGLTHDAALRVPEEYLTLPELFRHLGFTTVGVVSNGVLAADLGWDAGFDEYQETGKLAPEPSDDPVDYRKYLNARRVNELGLPLLERHRDAERLFAWFHYSDPHAPYLLPEGVENPFVGDSHYTGNEIAPLEEGRHVRLGDHRELRYYVAAYDANVHFADRHIGELLDRAGELGLLDDALVVFTADHGESLGEHGYYFGHGRLPYEPSAHVPLVLSWPGRLEAGARVPEVVELVDLYPTLVELIAPGQEVPGLEGESLAPLLLPAAAEAGPAPGAFELAFAEAGGGSPTTHFRSVRDARWKLVYHPPLGKAPRSWELYDLARDPGETVNLAEEETRELQRLRSVLAGWMKGSEWIRKGKDEVEVHTEETKKALRALGYIN